MSQEKVEPKIGQVWADNDPRHANVPRELVLIQETVKNKKPAFVCDVYVRGRVHTRRTTVLAERFKPTATGYRYVRG
jgi:hypothetical protein